MMDLNEIRKEAKQKACTLETLSELEQLKIDYLGKKGIVNGLMRHLKEANKEDIPRLGKEINQLKVFLTQFFEDLLLKKKKDLLDQRLKEEKVDVTAPGRRSFQGRKHPLNQVLEEVLDILSGMGFSVQQGPHIESEYYNFEALNIDQDHPARDMQDTFYISKEFLLRTHTSNIQARVMEANKPPIRIAAPGKVYRNEDISARSHVFFHQVEGLYIDKGVSFTDLMSTMKEFWSKFFKKEVNIRFRPSYFPFVEPGMEIDVGCMLCGGKGCPICKGTGFLEVAGAGMVHPKILENCGIDPDEYTGFAWGLGIERLAMLCYGMEDIRLFTENDQRFLRQF